MKAGFALIIGRSNVGKSTLLNSIAGTKLAAVTPKPQTTRNTIHGVYNDDRGQIVFVDTPGTYKITHSKLTSKLMSELKNTLEDIDVIVYIVDPTREIGDEEKATLSMIKKINVPKILVINKIDLPEKELRYLEWYKDLANEFNETIEISALKNKHVKSLIEKIFNYLDEGSPAYEDWQKTNLDDKHWVAEIIKEKVFLTNEKEIPYNAHVIVDSVEEREDGMFVISARVAVTTDKYKKMLIGTGAKKIKQIGTLARKELEVALDKKVFLDLKVETNPHWVAEFY